MSNMQWTQYHVELALDNEANLTGAYLTRANLTRADLTRANLTEADLTRADLTGADLTGAYLTRADLTEANLTEANLTRADLTGAYLAEAYLTEAYLTRADLTGADLTGAYLTEANLTGAYLTRANLTRADLTEANLTEANLTGAYLTGANLTGAKADHTTVGYWPVPPEGGSYIAWKKAMTSEGYPLIVKLIVPDNAQRSSATTRKCRASEVIVVQVEDLDGHVVDEPAYSNYDHTEYAPGTTVKPHHWEPDRWVECGGGIHHFITRQEAVIYDA